jgi:hypothetical protein
MRVGQMVWNAPVTVLDDIPQPIVALGNNYPDGHWIAPHQHRRGLLISGASGTVICSAPQGTWVMPPQRGMWIPLGIEDNVRLVGSVTLQSIFLEPNAIEGMPHHCQVLGITPFMRSLIAEALDLPDDPNGYAAALMALVQHECGGFPSCLYLRRFQPIKPSRTGASNF